MTEFVLKSKYFEFNLQIKHQISVAAIATKFSPFFFYIFMGEKET